MDNFISKLNDFMSPIKKFMLDNEGNPLIWMIIFGIGILFFATMYDTLNKNK